MDTVTQQQNKDFFRGSWHRTELTGQAKPPGELTIETLQPGLDQVRLKFDNFPEPWLNREISARHESGGLSLTVTADGNDYAFFIEGYLRDEGDDRKKHLGCRQGAPNELGPYPEEWDAEEEPG